MLLGHRWGFRGSLWKLVKDGECGEVQGETGISLAYCPAPLIGGDGREGGRGAGSGALGRAETTNEAR